MSLELMAEKSDFVNIIIIRRDFGPDRQWTLENVNERSFVLFFSIAAD